MIRPTQRALWGGFGLLGLAVLLATFAPGFWWVWAAAVFVLVTAFVYDAVFADRVEDFEFKVDWPSDFVGGESNSVPAKLRKRSGVKSSSISLKPRVEGANAEAKVSRASFGARLETPTTIDFDLGRRGPVRISGVEGSWLGPMGLIEKTCLFPGSSVDRLAVPSLKAVREAAMAWTSRRQLLQGAKVQRMVGDGREFDALREYQQGHDHRSIDWRTSARMRKLHVREYRDEKNHDVVLALDAGRAMSIADTDSTRLDSTISAALLLGYVSLTAGDKATLFAFERTQRVQSPTVQRIQHFSMLVRAAGSIPYSDAATNWHASFAALEQRLKRRSIVVVFTNLDDPIHAEGLVKALPFLTRRHLVIVAVLIDKSLGSLGDLPMTRDEDVQKAVLVDEMRREREVNLQTLRQQGLRVVEGDKESLATQILWHYSEVKRRGLV